MWLKCSLSSKNCFLPYSRLFSSNSRWLEPLFDLPWRFELSGVDCNSKRPHYFGESGSFIQLSYYLFRRCWSFPAPDYFRFLSHLSFNVAFVQIWHAECIASPSVGTHVLFFQLPKWRLGGVGVCYFSVVFFAPEKHWHELVTSMSVIFQGQQMISSSSQGKVEFFWLLVKIQAWTKMFVS